MPAQANCRRSALSGGEWGAAGCPILHTLFCAAGWDKEAQSFAYRAPIRQVMEHSFPDISIRLALISETQSIDFIGFSVYARAFL
jgi:hypothetical protein